MLATQCIMKDIFDFCLFNPKFSLVMDNIFPLKWSEITKETLIQHVC